jgi:type II secretory pathway component GspD/PulD (secretin)
MKSLALAVLLALATTAGAKQKSVTLDVKDEDVRTILRSMQQQCGVRNLLIDRDVQGKGTLYFRDVPCTAAFRTVFTQFGLAGEMDGNVISVEARSR